jgi:hypothetical protein
MDNYYKKTVLNKLQVLKLQMIQEIELYEEQIQEVDKILMQHNMIDKKKQIIKTKPIINEFILLLSGLTTTVGLLYYVICIM